MEAGKYGPKNGEQSLLFSTNQQRTEARWVFLPSFIAIGEREWSKLTRRATKLKSANILCVCVCVCLSTLEIKTPNL